MQNARPFSFKSNHFLTVQHVHNTRPQSSTTVSLLTTATPLHTPPPTPPLPLLYPSLLTSPKSELDETPCFLLREKSGKTHKLAVEDFEQQCLQT